MADIHKEIARFKEEHKMRMCSLEECYKSQVKRLEVEHQVYLMSIPESEKLKTLRELTVELHEKELLTTQIEHHLSKMRINMTKLDGTVRSIVTDVNAQPGDTLLKRLGRKRLASIMSTQGTPVASLRRKPKRLCREDDSVRPKIIFAKSHKVKAKDNTKKLPTGYKSKVNIQPYPLHIMQKPIKTNFTRRAQMGEVGVSKFGSPITSGDAVLFALTRKKISLDAAVATCGNGCTILPSARPSINEVFRSSTTTRLVKLKLELSNMLKMKPYAETPN